MKPAVPEPSPRTPPKPADQGAAPTGAAPKPAADGAWASREEVLEALNELLEAERAGARVAMETAREIPPSALASLVQDIHKDEVRWCGMLLRSINVLEGTPSSATGAFWGKAMAIPDLDQRLSFLSRGQAWVVRRLSALIPRVPHAQVQADLSAMLEAHLINIERVDARNAVDPDAQRG